MLETITGKVLNRLLSKYFEDDIQFSKTSLAVWSGYIKLVNLKIKTEIINEILAAKKLPFTILHCSIRSIEVTVPWRNLKNATVIVLNGVHVLIQLQEHRDDRNLIRKDEIKNRRRALANISIQRPDTKFVDKLLPTILEILQLHVRDLHIRVEGNMESPFGCGVILSSMHIQQDDTEESDNVIGKIAQINRLGVYWNALSSSEDRLTHRRYEFVDNIRRALDQTISRPSQPTSHTFLLIPVDGIWRANFSGRPPALVRAEFENVSLSFRDFQLLQIIGVLHTVKEHKYSRRHSHKRPLVKVKEDPRAWWLFALKAVKKELTEKHQRWSWGRFRDRIRSKQRYCSLYGKLLDTSRTISEEEKKELNDIEDGLLDDLLIQDIFFYRILVSKKLGVPTTETNSGSKWFHQKYSSILGEDVEDDDYERLLEYWDSWSISLENGAGSESISPRTVAISLEVHVSVGQVVLFSPLSSTADQPQQLRIQEHFLDFAFSGFRVQSQVLADYDSVIVEVSLYDFRSKEIRSNRKTYDVVYRESTESEGFVGSPLFSFRMTKNSPQIEKFRYSIRGNVRRLNVDLVAECEWIGKLKSLIQPLPQMRKMSKFWKELNMAYINSWASKRLGLLAKAQTAVTDHNAFDIHIAIDCPVLNVTISEDSTLVADLGRIEMKTEKLSGVARAQLFKEQNTDQVSRTYCAGVEDSVAHHGNSGFGQTQPPEHPDFQGASVRSGFSETAGNVNSSVFTAGSLVFDYSVDGPSFSNNLREHRRSSTDAQGLFYDTYDVLFRFGGVSLDTRESKQVVADFDSHFRLFRSIIPSDHTLSRFKMSGEIDEVAADISMAQLSLIFSFLQRWIVLLSNCGADSATIVCHDAPEWNLVNPTDDDLQTVEFSDDEEFDIDEFFDAAERPSESLDGQVDNIWIADSENDMSTPLRSRKRNASISEVSSISEGSLGRRKVAITGTGPLTAENLARLEEEDPLADDSGSRAESFHSAISEANLRALCRSLEADLNETQEKFTDATNTLLEARRKGADRDTIGALRLDKERLDVELKSLKAAHLDLLSLISSTRDSGVESSDYQGNASTLQSVKNASVLLHSVRGWRQQNGNMDTVHRATRGLKRRVIECSVIVKKFRLRYAASKHEDASDASCEEISVTMALKGVNFALSHQLSETKASFSIESLSVGLEEKASQQIICLGGLSDSETGCYLSSRYASMLNLPPQESVLLKASCTLKKGYRTESKAGFQVVALEVYFGEMELSLSLPSISRLLSAHFRFSSDLFSLKGNNGSVSSVTQRPQRNLLRVSASLQVASVRFFLLGTGGPDMLFSLTDSSLRTVASTSGNLFGDRMRVDVRCGNAQGFLFVGSGVAVEVVGKQDSYSPYLLRARLKVQLVTPKCTGGWVVDRPDHDEPVDVKVAVLGGVGATSCCPVWNCHLWVTVDSIQFQVSSAVLARVRNSVIAILTFRGETSKGGDVPRRESALQLPDTAFRWRAEFELKEMSACLQRPSPTLEGAQYHDFEICLGLVAALELSEKRGGVALLFVVNDIRMTRVSGLLKVVVPFRILGSLDVAIHHKYVAVSDELYRRRLLPHKSFTLPGLEDINFDSHTDNGDFDPDSVEVKIGAVRINATPQVVGELVLILQSLLSVVTAAPLKSHTSEVKRHRDGKERHHISLVAYIDSLSIVLAHEGRSNDRHSLTPLLMFFVHELVLRISVTQSRSSFGINATTLSLVDLVCIEGVQSLKVEGSGSNNPHAAVFVTAEITDVSSKACIDVSVMFGATQCLLLPSLVISLVSFWKEVESHLPFGSDTMSSTSEEKTNNCSLEVLQRVAEIASISMRFTSESFDLIISSRDIPGFVKQNQASSIGAVTVRLKAEMSLKILVAPTKESLARLIEKDRNFLSDISEGFYTGPSLSVETDISILRCEVLRTSMVKSSGHPVVFSLTAPVFGEQRITGVFSFALKHWASMIVHDGNPDTRATFCLAHALQLRSSLLDVLLYESPGGGGLSDAHRNTIIPILDLFRKVPSETTKEQPKYSVAKHCLSMSPLVVFVQFSGLKFTLVPGGATRLTESPIMKLELSEIDFKSGLNPATKSGSEYVWHRYGVRGTSDARSNVGRFCLVGTVVCFEIKASYHNRRLVAWEPFIEPWKLAMRAGVDLTRFLELPFSEGVERGPEPGLPVQSIPGESRLGQIGKLLTTPFKSARPDKTRVRTTPSDSAAANRDICFVLLRSFMENTFVCDESNREPALPGSNPFGWLSGFGFPESMVRDFLNPNASPLPSLVCSVTDFAPLNVNLTGALIENLAVYSHSTRTKRGAPHLIRNESGLVRTSMVLPYSHNSLSSQTIRFTEVLEYKKSPRVILRNCTEMPLSLKRLKSQSCDPHCAYILLELGNCEETGDRFSDSYGLDVSISSAFSFRVVSKVAVDTVGIYRYPLDRCSPDDRTRSFGWVIVRVALTDGVKVVSIESPLLLKNSTDIDFTCEIRTHGGIRVWESVIPKRQKSRKQSFIPVPSDLVPQLQSEAYFVGIVALSASHEHYGSSALSTDDMTQISPPPPYSRSAFSKGVVRETQVAVRVVDSWPDERKMKNCTSVHVEVCGVRIGSFAVGQASKRRQGKGTSSEIPEQRMLVFRSPLSIVNFLAVPIHVQVRAMKDIETSQRSWDYEGWSDAGVVDCFQDCSYSDATRNEEIEIRVRLCSNDQGDSRQYPCWSTAILLRADSTHAGNLSLVDCGGARLCLSVSTDFGGGEGLSVDMDDIRTFSGKMREASRIVRISSPIWIVDRSGLGLQFRCRQYVAGQDGAETSSMCAGEIVKSHGLGELLDNENIPLSASLDAYRVYMLSDDGSTHLYARRQPPRLLPYKVADWSRPIPLTISSGHLKASIPRDSAIGVGPRTYKVGFRIVRAPDAFGGQIETKLVEVFCRFFVINELGRDIDICQGRQKLVIASVKPDSRPQPIHPDDSRPMQFRPTECGWKWSGKIQVGRQDQEVLVQLSHEWKRQTILTSVIFPPRKNGSCTIVLRHAPHAPYRIENHTMYPIHFRQVTGIFNTAAVPTNDLKGGTLILPHHNSEFAFDEPDFGSRAVSLHLVDFRTLSRPITLGSFKIGEVALGERLKFVNTRLNGVVVAHGPTRVLQVTESPGYDIDNGYVNNAVKKQSSEVNSSSPALSVELHLTHGFGLSVVDWSPQEIVYLHVGDIVGAVYHDGSNEVGSLSVSTIAADNQLWITPFPVLLRIGNEEMRRNKREKAIALSWRRPLKRLDGQAESVYLESVSFSSLPSIVNVDGNLAEKLIAMGRRGKETLTTKRASDEATTTRDEWIRNILDLFREPSVYDSKSSSAVFDTLPEHTTTAATAAKQIMKLGASTASSDANAHLLANSRDRVVPKESPKVYVEKLRLSTISAKISWSGALPLAPWLPKVMRPALTFESLPLLLRPYSTSHKFGTIRDHMVAIRSHYTSFWRIIDLLAGVMSKPSFFVRAVIFTWRESCASVFAAIADGSKASEVSLAKSLPRRRGEYRYFSAVATSLVQSRCIALQRIASIADAMASMSRYNALHHRTGGEVVPTRCRNPRLFATIGGNDLLVQYSEGSNAGKALLSRIRTGAHLAEGYVFHLENVDLPYENGKFILMLTFERLLLVNAHLDKNFCKVHWEVCVSDLLHIQQDNSLHLWYVSNLTFGGLQILKCQHISTKDPQAFLSKLSALNSAALPDIPNHHKEQVQQAPVQI